MATIKRFEDLECWQVARKLNREVYAISKVGPFSKDYDLRSQIRRASTSVMANIAEGFDRGGNKELLNFLSIAKGSAGEVQSHLYVALDEGYVSQAQFQAIYDSVDSAKKLISGFTIYLQKSTCKGVKHMSSKR